MTSQPFLTVRVDPRLCEGHGLCLQSAPDVFDIDDTETAYCDHLPDIARLEEINAAAAACPRQAITVTSDGHSAEEDQR